jgi:hypothetical protein
MPLKKAGDVAAVQVVPDNLTGQVAAIQNMVPKADKPVTRATDKESYWANKEARDIETGIRIRRSGVFQAALQSPALMQYAPTLEDYIALVVRTADAGLAYVNE